MTASSWGPFVECVMSTNFHESGIGYVVAARQKSSQTLRCAAFIVDTFCLGVKDCMLKKCGAAEYVALKEKLGEASSLSRVEPSYAKKFLEDAVSYAKNIGFSPHADFQRYFNAFSDVDSSECRKIFSFGKDGKPFYIQGPKDSDQKAARIVRTLGAKLGSGGYDYAVGL